MPSVAILIYIFQWDNLFQAANNDDFWLGNVNCWVGNVLRIP